MTDPRLAQHDELEEQVMRKLREEIRLAKMQGGGTVTAGLVIQGHRVTKESWVLGAKWQPES